MIELIDNFIVGTDQLELEALQVLLTEFSPEFTFSILENEHLEVDPASFTLIIEIQNPSNSPDMSSFLEFLSSKIEEVNQQS